jgi:hypothetical protein
MNASSHPESFEIEIDRLKLAKFWQKQWGLLAGMPFLGLGALFSLGVYLGPENRQDFDSTMGVVLASAIGISIGLAIGALLLAVVYFLFIQPSAKREAKALQVSVEGPFFRIKTGSKHIRDRKLHFKSIIDYTYYQDPMMKECEIGGIALTTMAGGQNSTIRIQGIKNALEIRDLLSEIDSHRENL